MQLERYTPLSNLDDKEGAFRNAILESLIYHQTSGEDPDKVKRLAAQSFCLLGSLTANGSYVPISMHMPGGMSVRVICAISNYVAFFGLDVYATKQTVGDIWGVKGENERILLSQDQLSDRAKKLVIAASFIMALLAQMPIAYPSLKYDGKAGIPAMIFLLWGGLPIPLNSLYESCNWALDIKRKRSLDAFGKQIEGVREQALHLVEDYQDYFTHQPFLKKIEEIAKFKAVALLPSDSEKIDEYQSIVFHTPPQPEVSSRYKKWNRAVDGVSKVVGAFLTASLQTGTVIYTKVMTKEYMTSNPYAVGAFTAVVAVSSAVFYGNSIVDTTKRVFSSALNLAFGVNPYSISEQLRFKTTLALKLTALLINGFALGATFVIWDDLFKEKDERAKKVFFQVTELSALFLTLSAATADFIDGVVAQIIRSQGSVDEKNVIQLKEDLEKLHKFFRKSSVVDLGVALLRSGEDVRQRLLEQSSLSISELEGYVREKVSVV